MKSIFAPIAAPFAIGAALMLAACTGETEPVETEQLPDELVDETTQTQEIEDPVAREEPIPPEMNGAQSAETDQPTLGTNSVEGDLGSGAEPPNPPSN